MRKLLLLTSTFLAGSILSGCAGTIPVSYTAQNITRYDGSAHVGTFSYAPADSGEVAVNQIANTAIGKIYIPSSVADLVQRATALELEKTGIQLGAGNLVVSGDVLEFKADDLGYSVDWSYRIRYVISNSANNTELHRAIYTADPVKTGKFGRASDYSSSVNDMILSAYNKFISDAKVRAILTGD